MSLENSKLVLAIHGGAGVIQNLSEKMIFDYERCLSRALGVGYQELQQGKSAVDAVVSAIKVMEDSPLFNCGKGSVLTSKGTGRSCLKFFEINLHMTLI